MKIAILEPLGVEKQWFIEKCREAVGEGHDLEYFDTRTQNPAELIKRSQGADAVVFSNLPFPKEAIEKCPDLKYICVAFTGVDLVDVQFCKQQGIQVSNCAGYSTAAVGDLVFGLLLSLYRNLPACNKVVRQEGTKDGLIGMELEGKTFGVIGTGAIGLRVAKIAQAFGCRVLAYSRTVKQIEDISYVDLDTLLKESDIISLHVPSTPQTEGMIDAEKLSLMKKNAILLNTARGPVVDSQALADALKEGRIAGAGIDVFEMEPPVPKAHPLLEAPNVIATPHVAFATKEAMKKRAGIVCENLKAWISGTPVHLV